MSWNLALAPRVQAGIGPTLTLKDAGRRHVLLPQVPFRIRILFLFRWFLQIAFIKDRQHTVMNIIAAQHRQKTQDLQAWNRLLEQVLTCLRRVSGLSK